MQAITVKYLGPTNTRGTRLKATCRAGSITVGLDYSLDDDDQLAVVIDALLIKLGWTGLAYTIGQTHNNDYVAVLSAK